MNSSPEDNQLDQLLNQWASKTARPAHEDSLQRRILSASQRSSVIRPTTPADNQYVGRLTSVVASTCAVVILAVVVTGRAFLSSPAETDHGISMATLSPSDRQSKQQLLQELQALFGTSLAWVAETDTDLNVSVTETATERDDDGVVLLIRFVVQRRSGRNQPWQTAWQTDVISEFEEFVSVKASETTAIRNLWACRLPDGAVTVEYEIQPSDSDATFPQISLQRPGVPQHVTFRSSKGDEYRVLQNVEVLNERESAGVQFHGTPNSITQQTVAAPTSANKWPMKA